MTSNIDIFNASLKYMSYIEMRNITKKYPKSEYLSVKDFNLNIEKGEFIVFVGPSGCGKSTTLRMIAGLEDITSGDLIMEGEKINSLSSSNRNISMVFQSYALYPHMVVENNIKFSMQLKKISEEIQQQKTDWASRVLKISDNLKKFPKDLSGGQRQRVALARAIVRDPKLFLMDEPLSNLDAKLRGETRSEILKLHKTLEATIIYVTHDQVEAMTMGDRIVVMNQGIIQQIGSPLELYKKPANIFVATFLGLPSMNIVDAEITDGYLNIVDEKIKLTAGTIKNLNNYRGKVKLGIRPEDFKMSNLEIQTYEESTFNIIVNKIDYMGNEVHLFSTLSGKEIVLKSDGKIEYRIGDRINVALNVSKLHFFNVETGERING